MHRTTHRTTNPSSRVAAPDPASRPGPAVTRRGLLAAGVGLPAVTVAAPAPAGATVVRDRPVDVSDTGVEHADAVMDGRPHPLAERFTSLDEARAVFPTATSLAEQIDRHAIARVLAAGDVALGSGTALLDAPLLVPAGGRRRVLGVAPGQTVLRVLGGSGCGVLACADPRAANPGVVLAGFEVDGNRAENPSPASTVVAVDLAGADGLTVRDLVVHDVAGTGVRAASGEVPVAGQTWAGVTVTDCAHWGIAVTGAVTEASYLGLRVTRCGTRTDVPPDEGWPGTAGGATLRLTGGLLLDHARARVSAVHAHENGLPGAAPAAGSAGGCGVALRNVVSGNVSGLNVTGNGGHGVVVAGFVDSLLSDVVAQNNGRRVPGSHDVLWLAGEAVPAGRSRRSKVVGLVAGTNATAADWRGGEDWALYVEDGVDDLDVEGMRLTPGRLGDVRRPAGTAASLRIGRHVPLGVGVVPAGSWTGPRWLAPGTLRLVAGEARAVPWDVVDGVAVRAAALGVTVAGTAAATLRLGLFADDGTGQYPDVTAAGLVADLGTVAVTAVADVATARLAAPAVLGPRRVWLVARQEGTSTATATVRAGVPVAPIASPVLRTGSESGAVRVAGWTAPFTAGFPPGGTVVPTGVLVRVQAG